jgi:hypothetical protein
MAAQPLAIFLSYASQDATAARRLCEALREAGIEVWFDQSELRGGDAWDQKIRSQIRDCALFIPLISANTVSRLEGYFRLEWKLAVDRSHLMAAERTFILPVVMDATADNNAFVPEKFREVQWTRVADAETLSAFAQRVRQLLSPDYTAAPPANKSAAAKAAALAERTWLKSKAVPVVLAAVAALALGFIAVDRIRGSRPVATGADADNSGRCHRTEGDSREVRCRAGLR